MNNAVVVKNTGGPEVLNVVNIAKPKPPGPGQVTIRHTCIGLNYMDIYYRNGTYKAPKMPFIPGMEGVGVIEAVGKDVDAKVGTRVGYCTAILGSYCEYRTIAFKHLVSIPKEITDDVAAASLTKGMTAHYLLRRTFNVKSGDTLLVHAAAGGVGQFLCQWASSLGATVIGTVSTREKQMAATNSGCKYVINYKEEDFVKKVRQITKGRGVNVVYDSVGKDTFAKSIQCLSPMGLLVSYGQSSGPVPPLNILSLATKGIFVTRPTLNHYKADRMELLLTGIEVFKMIHDSTLKANIGYRFKLDDIAKAHYALENRQTIGSNIIVF